MNSAQASQNCGTVAVTDVPLAGDMYGGKSAEVMVYRKSSPGGVPRDAHGCEGARDQARCRGRAAGAG